MSLNSLLSRSELVQLLKDDKEFRESFALEFVKNTIPSQLKLLRQEREWTQDDLGKATNKPRNVITRLENPNSNVPNIATMYEMASGFEAALLVKIVPFSELLREFEKSHQSLSALPISHKDEKKALEEWIASENGESEPDVPEQTGSITEPYATNTGVPLNLIKPRNGGQQNLRFDHSPDLEIVPSSTAMEAIEESDTLSLTFDDVDESESEVTSFLFRVQQAG